ncbi:sugar ABC transporter permease [Paenibacillus sp. N1-5-1-14]|uniref:carbohydrate ABC transporter permease n=1 Tax=Paenibacillus radicibacter TaxID=2972488 RepID=UPI0021597FA1|nr:sugar ABC transporter permease [Paenibacillus radicibacter]MCR8644058.1 sugar ABC transporter permease [Paenibacillus radicibacter]
MNRTLRNPATFILFILPALILYSVFYIYPIFTTFQFGFTDYNGLSKPEYIGFENYVTALTDDPNFWVGFLNNVWFILFSIFVQVPIILLIAVLVAGVKRFRGFYKTTVFLPSILSTAVVGVLFTFVVFHPQIGILNSGLTAIGLESWTMGWLGDERTAMLSILVTNAWQWTGFYVVLVLAAIFGISKEVLEAAEIDGATSFQRTRFIIIPLIRPVIFVIILLSITGAMKALDIVIVMTNGGPFGSTEVMATYMYRVAFNQDYYGYGNAIANLIFIFSLLITLIFNSISKKYGDVEGE